MKKRFVGKRRRSAIAAAVLLACTAGGVAAAGPAQAAGDCTVRFVPNTWTVDANGNANYTVDGEGNLVWNGKPSVALGFQGTFEVTNTGAALYPWKASWKSWAGTKLISAGIYNAQLVSRTAQLWWVSWHVTGADWNASLPSGGSVSFGFMGVVPDPRADPSRIATQFSLSNRPCTVVS